MPARRHAGGVLRHDAIGSTTYGSVASILKHGLDDAYAKETPQNEEPLRHSNIRGSGYYH